MKKALHYDWSYEDIRDIYHRPLLDLVFEAAQRHRQHFDGRTIQVSRLISVKTGGCPEDCAYCPQAARYHTDVKSTPLISVSEVVEVAEKAKETGASRICLGAAWREVREGKDFDQILEMVQEISNRGMEVCCTLGMLDEKQAVQLKEAGLYAYNHNIDTSENHYKQIIGTRTFQDRLKTLKNVRKAQLQVCCGGIIGMGESVDDRVDMLLTLANSNPHPESVPINMLVAVPGTPLGDAGDAEKEGKWDELLRMVATTRLVMPHSFVRLSAGRLGLGLSQQALCFLAGANSIFSGEKLLTTPNPERAMDEEMFQVLGLRESRPFALPRS